MATSYVLLCCNQKVKGKCCNLFGATEAFNYFKKQLAAASDKLDPLKKVRVLKTSCLGACAYGPNIYIQSDNVWYTYNSLEDIDIIIKTHLVEGGLVHHLINQDIQP